VRNRLPLCSEIAQKQKWQKEYFQGKLPDGQSASVVHETRLKLAPFVDRASQKLES